jgi:hypothetical protein
MACEGILPIVEMSSDDWVYTVVTDRSAKLLDQVPGTADKGGSEQCRKAMA